MGFEVSVSKFIRVFYFLVILSFNGRNILSTFPGKDLGFSRQLLREDTGLCFSFQVAGK